jgi:hypothetical protein
VVSVGQLGTSHCDCKLSLTVDVVESIADAQHR